MSVILDTGIVPAADRADVIRETIARAFVRVDISFDEGRGPAAAVGSITDFGHLTICSVRSNARTMERTPRFARDEMTPSILVGLQMSGASGVTQGGREALLRPGELVLYDSTEPYVLTDPDGIRQHFFRISLDRLGLPHDAIRQVSAVTLSPGHPVADLAATYFGRLGSRPDLFAVPGAEALSEPGIALIRAVITTHLDAVELGKDPLKATLPLRILEYARAHLSDPTLGAAQVAAEHHISVRHLYNILGANGITLADWVRTHRLEGCREEIIAAASSTSPIGSIALRWGFTDPSSFARTFKTAYGMSPRQWRHHNATGRFDLIAEPVAAAL
jgi:AraC-like DNA-binding protein